MVASNKSNIQDITRQARRAIGELITWVGKLGPTLRHIITCKDRMG